MVTLITGSRASGKTRLAALMARRYSEEESTVCVVECFDGDKARLLNYQNYLEGIVGAFGPLSKIDLWTLQHLHDHLIIVVNSNQKVLTPKVDFVYNLATTRHIHTFGQ